MHTNSNQAPEKVFLQGPAAILLVFIPSDLLLFLDSWQLVAFIVTYVIHVHA